MAIDGKSWRGSDSAHAGAIHLLAAMDQATGCVLGRMAVDARTNEHKAALELLGGLALEGRVVTGDARDAAIGRLRIFGSTNIAASPRRNAARARELPRVMRILTK